MAISPTDINARVSGVLRAVEPGDNAAAPGQHAARLERALLQRVRDHRIVDALRNPH